MKIGLLLLVVKFAYCLNAANADTITIHLETACNNFMPHRQHVVIPATSTEEKVEYDDSIRVCGQIVDGFRKNYYLIVYDMQGVKRMEGSFYDHLAEGHCISYDFRGRKTSEGDYKLVKKRGYYYPSVKTGVWIYYDLKGGIIKKEKFK